VSVFPLLVIIHTLTATVWTGGHLALDLGVLPGRRVRSRCEPLRRSSSLWDLQLWRSRCSPGCGWWCLNCGRSCRPCGCGTWTGALIEVGPLLDERVEAVIQRCRAGEWAPMTHDQCVHLH